MVASSCWGFKIETVSIFEKLETHEPKLKSRNLNTSTKHWFKRFNWVHNVLLRLVLSQKARELTDFMTAADVKLNLEDLFIWLRLIAHKLAEEIRTPILYVQNFQCMKNNKNRAF